MTKDKDCSVYIYIYIYIKGYSCVSDYDKQAVVALTKSGQHRIPYTLQVKDQRFVPMDYVPIFSVTF